MAKMNEFIPPSVKMPINPYTESIFSEIPRDICENQGGDTNRKIVLGVDEAGRGPVLGPMVYGISYCFQDYENELKRKYGFADSKVLKDDKRCELFKMIVNRNEELYDKIGWGVTIITSCDISSDMFKPNSVGGNINLNEQAHEVTIGLIKRVLEMGVNLSHVYVDTVGPPISYEKKLYERFRDYGYMDINFTVTKKADSLFPIVSTASVVAKVTRDINLKNILNTNNQIIGSGYPGDPNTVKWLNNNVDQLFGYDYKLVRFSWQTTKDCLKRHGCIKVTWEDDIEIKSYDNGNSLDNYNNKKANSSILSNKWFIE